MQWLAQPRGAKDIQGPKGWQTGSPAAATRSPEAATSAAKVSDDVWYRVVQARI